MRKKELDHGWMMRQNGTGEFLPAVVPGSVYTDLMANGKMEDPYYRDNEYQALEVISHDYEYRVDFTAEAEIREEDEVLLRFDGIDTLADIWLNEVYLGKTNNMHRIWEFSVKSLLKEENTLRAVLYSPTDFIARSYEEEPIIGCVDAMKGLPRLRKGHSMFGWDWGPRIPDAGIWRKVSLLGVHKGRLESVSVTQTHDDGKVLLGFQPEILKCCEGGEKRAGAGDGFSCHITVTDPKGKQQNTRLEEDISEKGEMEIKEPCLWWPNGYGEQPLYTVCVQLWKDGELLDVWERRIGLRTMGVSRRKDEFGEEFAHEVNGIRIFAMGADYIPEDNLLPRVNGERTRRLLEACRDAHFNVIRVWGGGYYPDDFFYDICDELGLVVWQDFMFACCVYDLTEEFDRNIRAEFADNIRRIRHHASLGLWCGNNEMEYFLEMDEKGWCLKPSQKSDYFKMFEYIIPQVLKELDPNTFYWPASPSSGGGFDAPNDENRGDVHYWDVWHGGKPFTEYRKFFFRYLSEFGFQSFPSLQTVETFTRPEERNIFSYVMEKHQRNSSANGKIMSYMEQTFLYPSRFDTILYASQLLQAEAMRCGVEHFRRNRGRCMGTVIWQLNDCWPAASWSSIDYYGRSKALHYYAKRFFAPVLLSCEEEGMLTQDPNVNAQPFEVRRSIRLNVANETMQTQRGMVIWSLRDPSAAIIREESVRIEAGPLSSLWLDKVELPEAGLFENYVSFRLEADGEILSSGSVLFCAPKYFAFRDPCLQVRAEGEELVVTADAYARSVEIHNAADDMLLEDNYFDMDAGTRRVKIREGKPEGLTIRSVYDIR